MKSVPENELFSAYLDGELTPDEQARIESLIDANAEAAALVRSLRAVSESIQALPQAPMPKELTATILANIPQRMREAGRSSYGTDGDCDTDAVSENTGEETGEDERASEEYEHLLACCSIDSDQTPPNSNATVEESVPQKSRWFQQFHPWTKRSRLFSIRLTSALLLACMTLGGLSWMIYSYDKGSRHAKMIAQNDTMEDKTLATASVPRVKLENAAAEVIQKESYEALSNDPDNVLGDSVSQESYTEQSHTIEQNMAPHNEMENATKADSSYFGIHAQSVMSTPTVPTSPRDANQNVQPTVNNRARSFQKEMSSESSPALTSSPMPPASPRMSSIPPQEEIGSSMDFDHSKMQSNSSMYSMHNSIPALESSAVNRDESISEVATQTSANPSAETESTPWNMVEKSVETMVESGSPNAKAMEKNHTNSETNANGDVMLHPHKEFFRGGPGGQRLSGMEMSGGMGGMAGSTSSKNNSSGNIGMNSGSMGGMTVVDMSSGVMSGGGLIGMSGIGGGMSSGNVNTVHGRMMTSPERLWSEPDTHETVSVNEILQSDPMGNDMENICDISSDSSVRDSISTDQSEAVDGAFRAGRSPSSALYREQGHDRSRIAASQATRTHKSSHPWIKNLIGRFTMVLKSPNSIHTDDLSTTENIHLSENTMARKSEFMATAVKVVTTSTLVTTCPQTPNFYLGVVDIMCTSIRSHWVPLIDDLLTEK